MLVQLHRYTHEIINNLSVWELFSVLSVIYLLFFTFYNILHCNFNDASAFRQSFKRHSRRSVIHWTDIRITGRTVHVINSRPRKIAGAAVFIYPFIRSGFRYLIPKQSLSILLPLSVTNILSYALFTATGNAPSSYRFTIKSASISICNSLLSMPA